MIKDIFNAKVVHMGEYDEVHLFDSAVVTRDMLAVDSDGVIYRKERKKGRMELNPFTGEYERMTSFDTENALSKYQSYKRTVDNITKYCEYNKPWDLFVTFTLSPDKVDRYNFDDCSKKLAKWLNNIRQRKCPDIKYLVVPEKHKDGAWHFHGLFGNVEGLDIVYSGHNDNKGRAIYNIHNYRYGFTTATYLDDVDKSISYIIKYIKKDLFDDVKGKKRYWRSYNLDFPESETFDWTASEAEKLLFLSPYIEHIYSSESQYLKTNYVRLNCKLDKLEKLFIRMVE